jgi:hypothetical protein
MNTFSVIMNEVNELFLRRFFAFAQLDGAVNQDYGGSHAGDAARRYVAGLG